ncbi:MAG: MMPL family transporter, partial [Mobilicoccus sp.]|nr:MMPL family transporter [Mobilicoccus sp.]
YGRGAGDKRTAVLGSVTTYTPIVVAAGVTVALATLSLVVAQSAFYRPFGPAMAVTIMIGLVVAITLVPAIVAILGRATFWPRRQEGIESMASPSAAMAFIVRELSRPFPASLALVTSIVLLAFLALPLGGMALRAGFTSSLPADNEVKRAAVAASEGFSPGVVSPTSVLLEGDGLADDLEGLIDLQQRVDTLPGVTGVIGPSLSIPQSEFDVFTSPEHDAARMLVILDHSPLDATAVQTLDSLRAQLPDLAAASGLTLDRIGVGGDSALAADVIGETHGDLWRLALAGIAVNLLILIVFLRAVVAPIYLLACNMLSVAAALGLTTWVFMEFLGEDGITFYVPFAAAVLLVALGSDYNIFGIGRAWDEARHRPIPEAMAIAMPETSKAITTAGVVLAASFAMLATIPLTAFRELAFTMAVGIMLDVFVVRTFMVPSLLTLVGDKSAWPRPGLRVDTERTS